ncbi:MAG: hypothetical protein HXY40_06450 [Chloroflexi bacterium]|nr:hypothetical protein [Chloroflexota bacterium]
MASKKSNAEAKIERVTWFLLVLVFALLSIFPDIQLPNWAVPLAGAIILLGSGIYQYTNKWRVSPITWIAGTLMLFFALMNLAFGFNYNFLGPSLLVFAAVIGFGIITGET